MLAIQLQAYIKYLFGTNNTLSTIKDTDISSKNSFNQLWR